MKLIKKIFCVALLIFGTNLFGQFSANEGGISLPTITPPSPEAAALTKFTDIPVSHYTGIANVGIPIHTIAQNGISIPIRLSYHGRGVQVADIAPRTGTGWSLTYGGSISRQVRGKADESFRFGYLSNKSEFMNYATDLTARQSVAQNEVSDPGYDFYPDLFSFNAGESSGKFILDYRDGQPVLQSFGDIKINYTREGGETGKIDSFRITDASGNIFYYGISKDGLRERQDYQTSVGKSIYINRVVDDPASNTEISYSSWKLMDIETPYGELISYHYENDFGIYYRKAYDKHDIDDLGAANSVSNFDKIFKIHTRLSKINNNECQLKEIVYNKGRIVFNKQNTLRKDFNGHALDKISIYDNNDRKIKSYTFNYTYTTSTDQRNLLGYFKNNSQFSKSFKRLFLNSIEEEGNEGEKLAPYSFTYNSTVLPSRYSTSKDYWGYYNGANNGPFCRMFKYGSYSSNRTVDARKSEAGLLTEIKYPTGGITKFTYEDNIGRPPVYANKVKIPEINPNTDVKDREEILLTKKDFWDSESGFYKNVTLSFPPGSVVKYIPFCTHLTFVDGDPDIPDCIFNFFMDGGLMQTNEERIFTATGAKRNRVISISPIRPSADNPNIPRDAHLLEHNDFALSFSYPKPASTSVSNDMFAGGKRVNKISYITENHTRIKEFEYTLLGSTASSGTIQGLPAFINKSNTFSPDVPVLTSYYGSDSAYGTFQPNSIGYSHVIEYNGTKQANLGKTEYTFTNLSDSGGDYYEFPYHPPTDNEWLRGKNVRTKIYKNNGDNTYSVVKEVYNKYSYGNTIYQDDFVFAGFTNINFQFTPEAKRFDWDQNSTSSTYQKNRTRFTLPLFMRERFPFGEDINTFVSGYRTYHFTGGTVHLHSSTETEYVNDLPFQSQTRYGYDYDNHYQMVSSEITDSNANVLKTEYTYPTIGSSLRNDNRMIPLRTKVFENNQKLSEQLTIYDTFGSTIMFPEIIQAAKGSNLLQDRIHYYDYDDYGNPLEVSKTDAPRSIYIWGYNNQYPIAKIDNASYVDMPSAVRNLITQLKNISNTENSSAAEQQMRDKYEQLNAHTFFKNSLITGYTYDPLIGVTSVTDPRGYTMTYHYDEFNRLQFVKDAYGNLISEHDYNYKNN